jgi:hypothetical protein
VWVFRTDDCLSCQAVDYPVRRVQSKFGAGVPFVAVHVGQTSEREIPRAFFSARRIRVDRLVEISPDQWAAEFPGTVLPSLFVIKNADIYWSSTFFGRAGAKKIVLDTLVEAVASGRMAPDTFNLRRARTLPPR